MATRADVINALSHGAGFLQSYDTSAAGCWVNLIVSEASDTLLEYCVGPDPDPAKVLDEVHSILAEAGVA